MRALWIALLATGACYEGEAPPCTISCNADVDCPGDLVCSPEGRCAVTAQSCAITCTPSSYLRCNGEPSAQICGADGASAETFTCAGGCVADESGPHCRHIVPSFAPAICDRLADTATLGFDAVDTILVDTCETQVPQAAGAICVQHARSMAVRGPEIMGTVPVAFVADGDLTVTAADVSALAMFAGPGHAFETSGSPPTSTGGGGGAGYATAGGGGGPFGANGGAAIDPATATELVGGASAATAATVFGGAGAGAIMLISCQGRVTIDGDILANGGGGGGGRVLAGTSYAGAGGGAGGHIVIQAVDVMITATTRIFANGGGGGGGIPTSGTSDAGEDGSQSATSGAAGGNSGAGAGTGGTGGFRDHAPGAGGGDAFSVTPGSAGGGGGAAGVVEILMPADAMPIIGVGASISPAPLASRTIPLR